MRTPLIAGIVIAVVLVLAVIVVPKFRSAEDRAADQAREQAALAERLLHRYDYELPELARAADPKALEKAGPPALAEKAREDLLRVSKDYSSAVQDLRSRAEHKPIRPPQVKPLAADAAGLQQALIQYQDDLKGNANLLAEASKVAKAARGGAGANVLGVPQIAGMVEYVRAAGLLAEAEVLRREQAMLQGRLLALGAEWRAYRSSQDYLAGLDVRDILAGLRRDLEEGTPTQPSLHKMAEDAEQQAKKLADDVAAREQEIAQVDAALQKARAEQLALEQRGFTAGDDASFNAYREKYLGLAGQLGTLQAQEQLLRFGGRKDAQFVGDDLETAKIEGGETVIGLEEMQRKLGPLQERTKRLATAIKALEEHIKFVEQAGQAAKQGEGRYAELRSQLDQQLEQMMKQELPKLIDEASKKEAEALNAAREAASAFDAAQQAADKLVSHEREVQSTLDPERRNPRLAKILEDPSFGQVGASARAAALVLTGNIYAQRIAADRGLLTDMKLFTDMHPGTSFDSKRFDDDLKAALDAANDTLKKAEEIYKKLDGKAKPYAKYIPEMSLAVVYDLLARIQPDEASTYLAEAARVAGDAVKGREKSPYLSEHLLFQRHLATLQGEARPGAETQSEKEGGG